MTGAYGAKNIVNKPEGGTPMQHPRLPLTLTLASLVVVLLSACQTTAGSSSSQSATTATPTSRATPPGMNDRGEVVDSSKIEAGHGKKVKGLNDWEGEITGKPAPGTKFTRLQIGMSRQQVLDIVGQPTDQGAYITGKAFIPFFWGSDRYRHELAYKGQGRLIFAGSSGFDSNAHLIWIIHNANDSGYR